ncbi:uncharacterized mitochondrial protein-like protein, partial [Tanacetum coccineum]
MDLGLAVPVFNQGDDPIAYLNKAIAFLTVVASSRFPSTNNQLYTSSNQRNQATIQDDRVTVQQVQGRQGQSYASTGYKGNATSSLGNNAGGQTRVVKCYNCQGEGHMARQCTQPKRPRNPIQEFQTVKLLRQPFQTMLLSRLRILMLMISNCDEVSNEKAVLMVNLSNYGSDVISEVQHFESNHTDLDNQSVHAMINFEQTPVVDFTDNKITSDSNIISYSQYLQEMQKVAVQDTNLYAQQDSMILSVIEQMSEQMINHKSQWIKPTLYDGSVISSQHAVNPVIDDEETLILEEVSRSKMLAKQNDPISQEKKVNTTPINYVELNRLSEDFGKRFVLKQELSAEQAF